MYINYFCISLQITVANLFFFLLFLYIQKAMREILVIDELRYALCEDLLLSNTQ